MGLELRQQLKLAQQLVMTPQLQQAIKLLQLSRMELLATVRKELLENPLLDEKAEEEAQDIRSSGDSGEKEFKEQELRKVGETDGDKKMQRDLARDADWEDYLGEFSSTARRTQAREMEVSGDVMSYETRLSEKPSLEGHLNWQLRLSSFTPKEVEIGEAVIGNLDSMGYLRATLGDIAELTGCTTEEAESVLTRIQRFDPVGVAARTPRECLLVQLDFYGHNDPILVEFVREHLKDLEKKRYKPLARKFKISMEQIKKYLDILQTLDPMPGASYGASEPYYISPDVYVYKFDEEFVIVLNEDGLPKLQLNSFYMDNLQANSEKDKGYLQEKMRSAVWLLKSLYQRQRTLYKVVESIVKFQHDFFERGIEHLKPLILKDVADDIDMHESTVSRITTHKYAATPFGVFELKFFFNSALGLDDGTQMGSESVKATIKQLISEEDPKKPFSDEKIVDFLREKLTVNIARRTVAKYRSTLGILSSSKRKQVF